jgi:hypothetical protein
MFAKRVIEKYGNDGGNKDWGRDMVDDSFRVETYNEMYCGIGEEASKRSFYSMYGMARAYEIHRVSYDGDEQSDTDYDKEEKEDDDRKGFSLQTLAHHASHLIDAFSESTQHWTIDFAQTMHAILVLQSPEHVDLALTCSVAGAHLLTMEDKHGVSPLFAAACTGNLLLLKHVMSQCRHIIHLERKVWHRYNQQTHDPLVGACIGGNIAMIEFIASFFSSRARLSESCLQDMMMAATCANNLDILHYLFSERASKRLQFDTNNIRDVNQTCMKCIAGQERKKSKTSCSSSSSSTTLELFRGIRGYNLLHLAVENESFACFKYLVDKFPDMLSRDPSSRRNRDYGDYGNDDEDASGSELDNYIITRSPLELIIVQNRLGIFSYICKTYPETVRSGVGMPPTCLGTKANILHVAATYARREIIEMILDCCGTPDVLEYENCHGQTTLHHAVRSADLIRFHRRSMSIGS